MSFEKWVADAERLTSQLPPAALAVSRARYLLDSVAFRGLEIDPGFFERALSSVVLDLAAQGGVFWVVNKSSMKGATHKLGRIVAGTRVASVTHGPGLPSILTLTDYNPRAVVGNGSILLHELQHITENEEGLTVLSLKDREATADLGKRERRAYSLNTEILEAADGSDFAHLIDNWPATFVTSESAGKISAEISFHDDPCPEPPGETLARDMWLEGEVSQLMLQSIGRMTVLEKLTRGLPGEVINLMAGTAQTEGST